MSGVALALWGLGVVLIAVGYLRARDPWRRYQALRAQAQNEARYAGWRGGVRSAGETGADVAMAIFRREARVGGAIAAAGFVLVVVGFLLG